LLSIQSLLQKSDFVLPISNGSPCRLAIGWLVLSIASLVIAGLFSILLVLSRTPYVQDIFPWVDFFHKALVVHVDLSVMIWFLSFAGVFWSLNSTPYWPRSGWLALGLSALGTLIIAFSPFMSSGNPLMNNYVPVLQNPVFFTGLVVFAIGIVLLLIRSLSGVIPLRIPMDGVNALRSGIYVATIIASIALVAFVWSYMTIPDTIHGVGYYEILFWGGGHVLQFLHTTLMLVSWLWLAGASGADIRIRPVMASAIFGLNIVPAIITLLVYLSFSVDSFEHRQAFTLLMKYGMGLSPLLIGTAALLGIARGKTPADMRHIRAALITSMILFGSGGIIGFLIRSSNVTIPAHYHGAIVGVTLSYMGLTYYLLPQLGFRNPSIRIAQIQPYIYGGGQLLHILGLAWAGGYGVQRKIAGSAQALGNIKKIISMGLMGMGGLIAVIGGFLFLMIVIHAMWPSRHS